MHLIDIHFLSTTWWRVCDSIRLCCGRICGTYVCLYVYITKMNGLLRSCFLPFYYIIWRTHVCIYMCVCCVCYYEAHKFATRCCFNHKAPLRLCVWYICAVYIIQRNDKSHSRGCIYVYIHISVRAELCVCCRLFAALKTWLNRNRYLIVAAFRGISSRKKRSTTKNIILCVCFCVFANSKYIIYIYNIIYTTKRSSRRVYVSHENRHACVCLCVCVT